MYGIINQAIEDYIVTSFGPEVWQELYQELGQPTQLAAKSSFLTAQSYPDQLTLQIIESASDILQIPAEALLRGVGRNWLSFVEASGYRDLLSLAGQDFPSFLERVDDIHAQILSVMPHAKSPTIDVQELAPDTYRVRYRTTRPWLTPFLAGCLEAVAERFHQQIICEDLQEDETAGGEFLVRLVEGPITQMNAGGTHCG